VSAVYVVLYSVPYQGDLLEAIYATETEADEYIATKKHKSGFPGEYRVEEWTVKGAIPPADRAAGRGGGWVPKVGDRVFFDDMIWTVREGPTLTVQLAIKGTLGYAYETVPVADLAPAGPGGSGG
jgi:hypothetical protein